eukprot:NODE_92_length_1641_cov_1036.870542_g90_i0.p1 GENE.NODE_92_length_1641_cov_1036.870542_g90_i0~~NODE_92_length_1641_cov_1036.870542_g90_i0.p1  ORF type:complete len:435 (-),score=55.73 NODE_92_length_1641_cov_1036.870542_g90_i0:277-1581(-)
MTSEKSGDYERWWLNRSGGSPLRGSSPGRRDHTSPPLRDSPLRRTNPPTSSTLSYRNESPGLRHTHDHTPRDWSPFRNLSGHGTATSDYSLPYQRQQQSSFTKTSSTHNGNSSTNPRHSPRRQHSSSPARVNTSPRDSYNSYESSLHSPGRHEPLHTQPQYHSHTSTELQRRRDSPLTRPAWASSNTTSITSTTPRRDTPTSSNTVSKESPITQVSRDGGPQAIHWPKEFLPPEPDPRTFTPLLPPKERAFQSRNTLVLDLDETLVHSSFKAITLVDMLIDIELEGEMHTVYVRKRPWVEDFLQRVSELYEVVVLTASLEVYADPVLDELDPEGYWVHHRLFRDSCANLNGNYIKDLSYLGRPLHQVIIIDNAPTSYLFQPRNALPISSWFDDPSDTELRDLFPVLEKAARVDNVYPVLDGYRQATANGERWYP